MSRPFVIFDDITSPEPRWWQWRKRRAWQRLWRDDVVMSSWFAWQVHRAQEIASAATKAGPEGPADAEGEAEG